MELKQGLETRRKWEADLLIVPYGIETEWRHNYMWMGKKLLIVPYGIETAYTAYCHRILYSLLIVPYGIETVLLDVNQCRHVFF